MKWPLLAVMLASSCMYAPTAPSEVPDWVHPYWQQAQRELIAVGYVRAGEIPPNWFRFIAHPPDPRCGNCYYLGTQWVYGHYGTFGGVHYCTEARHVVRHEAGHAILHKLGSKKWMCWEHKCW